MNLLLNLWLLSVIANEKGGNLLLVFLFFFFFFSFFVCWFVCLFVCLFFCYFHEFETRKE